MRTQDDIPPHIAHGWHTSMVTNLAISGAMLVSCGIVRLPDKDKEVMDVWALGESSAELVATLEEHGAVSTVCIAGNTLFGKACTNGTDKLIKWQHGGGA